MRNWILAEDAYCVAWECVVLRPPYIDYIKFSLSTMLLTDHMHIIIPLTNDIQLWNKNANI
jgi:hypothetical protein